MKNVRFADYESGIFDSEANKCDLVSTNGIGFDGEHYVKTSTGFLSRTLTRVVCRKNK